MKKLAVLLALALTVAVTSALATATSMFTDVPANHWAANDIKALTDGGLLNGMGNGKYDPDGTLTVAQMAKIICTAKGLGDNDATYWATEYIKICQDTIRCLPDFGAINFANYDIPCTRELAAYMIVNGLGTKDGLKDNKKLSDIPDWKYIDDAYSQAVLRAYNEKLLTGMDDIGTFNPKGTLTRAQVAAILNRAGFTTAAQKATASNTTGKAGNEIMELVKGWSDETWKEYTSTTGAERALTATDAKWGGVELTNRSRSPEALSISMPEKYSAAWSDEDYYKTFNADTVVTVSSGFSYDARQLVLRVLKEAYPTGYQEAYDALLSVMKQEIFEVPVKYTASALRWIDGRSYKIILNSDAHTINITIGAIGYETAYNADMADKHVSHGMRYRSDFGGTFDLTKMYELDRG